MSEAEEKINEFINKTSTKCKRCSQNVSFIANKEFTVRCSFCRVQYNLFESTIFSITNIDIQTKLQIIKMWCSKVSASAISETLDVSHWQVCKFIRFLTERLILKYHQLPIEKIGGKGIVVEIDESKFGKVKYHRGHRVDGVWVFGMVEKTPEKRIILVPVEKRDRETLEKLLTKYVDPGSIIQSDCWKAYSQLSSLFACHRTVNHSMWFVDPKTNLNTNTIEGNWSGIKQQVFNAHRTKKSIKSYLIRYMLRRKYAKNIFIEVLLLLLHSK